MNASRTAVLTALLLVLASGGVVAQGLTDDLPLVRQTTLDSSSVDKRLTDDFPFAPRSIHPPHVSDWPHAGKASTGGTHRVIPLEGGFDSTLAINLLRALDSVRTIYGAVGFSAGMFIPGEGTWVGASGISSVSDTLNADMIFGIASNTKTFVATLIMKLVEEGVLSLDDSVGRWLPPYPNIPGTVTIRQLLNMTSGIFDVLNDSFGACDAINTHPEQYWSPEEVLTTFVEDTTFFPPGVDWRYSNTNYILLGLIIQEATNSTVSAQLHKKIFEPLNLGHTFLETEDTLSGTIAHSWSCSPSALCCGGPPSFDIFSIPRTALYSIGWTSASIFSRADNLVEWNQQLFGGNVLLPGSLNEMQNLIPLYLPSDIYYGYGLGIFRVSAWGRLFWGHSGSYPGYVSRVFYLPQTGATIVVLANQRPDSPISQMLEALTTVYLRTVPSQAAQPGTMYTSSGSADGLLHSVNTSNGQATEIGPYIYHQIPSLTVNPMTGQLIGLADDYFAWYLARIDPTTGDSYPLSLLSLSESTVLEGMAFRGDTLYIGSSNGLLYRVEVATGTATLIAQTGINISGLAFHPTTGELWASDKSATVPGRIFKIDLPTGDTTLVGSTGFGQVTQDILFDEDGNLFGLVGSGAQTNTLVHIDTASGAGTLIGSTGRQGLLSLAMLSDSGIVSVKGPDSSLPIAFSLSQNYPNPFNPSTTVEYALPEASQVTLKIYNQLGQEVRTLVDEHQPAGYKSVVWDGRNNLGSTVSTGVYICRITAGRFAKSSKMLLAK